MIDKETGRLKASTAVADYMRRRYRAYCTAADTALAPLWAKVAAEQNLLVCVVSDHGEGLGEGGVWHHGDQPAFQRPEMLRVLFGAVPPGGCWPRGIPPDITSNAQLWSVVEACLPRDGGSGEAAMRETLMALGYVG